MSLYSLLVSIHIILYGVMFLLGSSDSTHSVRKIRLITLLEKITFQFLNSSFRKDYIMVTLLI